MAVAPNSINYGDQLPLGIEAKSQRRLFFPTTGDSYTGSNNSIIRFNINYDGMLDTSLSYLLFDFTNATTGASKNVVRDLGQPEIARLVVSSGGVVLEDIINYNHLVGGILAPCQYGAGQVAEACQNLQAFKDVQLGVENATAANVKTFRNGTSLGALQYENPEATTTKARTDGNAEGTDRWTGSALLKDGQTTKVCYKLYSGLLDNDKYLPLVLMNNGLDIEIHLAPPKDVLVCGPATNSTPEYTIGNIRYVAHLIDLQRDFYDMLRMTQQQSGGVIQIAGTSYRNFTSNYDKVVPTQSTHNIPVRARSIKSVLFKCAPRTISQENFGLSSASHGDIQELQIKVGATLYPPTSIKVNRNSNTAEPYFELMKSFGKLGSTIHENLLRGANYMSVGNVALAVKDSLASFAPYGIDLETFRAELENGLDTSSRALPMTLLLNSGGGDLKTDMTLQIFAMIDSLFFINMDGSVSVSS